MRLEPSKVKANESRTRFAAGTRRRTVRGETLRRLDLESLESRTLMDQRQIPAASVGGADPARAWSRADRAGQYAILMGTGIRLGRRGPQNRQHALADPRPGSLPPVRVRPVLEPALQLRITQNP